MSSNISRILKFHQQYFCNCFIVERVCPFKLCWNKTIVYQFVYDSKTSKYLQNIHNLPLIKNNRRIQCKDLNNLNDHESFYFQGSCYVIIH